MDEGGFIVVSLQGERVEHSQEALPCLLHFFVTFSVAKCNAGVEMFTDYPAIASHTTNLVCAGVLLEE